MKYETLYQLLNAAYKCKPEKERGKEKNYNLYQCKRERREKKRKERKKKKKKTTDIYNFDLAGNNKVWAITSFSKMNNS